MCPPVSAEADAATEGAGPGGAALSPEALKRRKKQLVAPPFSGEGVRWPQSEAEAHFLHRRKILTVNGTHTTLAFHTLAVHEPPPHAGLPVGDYELLRAAAKADTEPPSPTRMDTDAAMDAELQARRAAAPLDPVSLAPSLSPLS